MALPPTKGAKTMALEPVMKVDLEVMSSFFPMTKVGRMRIMENVGGGVVVVYQLSVAWWARILLAE